MVGWFALNLPAGLSLYYFSNTVFTSGQQIFLRKLGGANIADFDLGPIELGKARRTGSSASMDASSTVENAMYDSSEEVGNGAGAVGTPSSLAYAAAPMNGKVAGIPAEEERLDRANVAVSLNRRCKRKKKELLEA